MTQEEKQLLIKDLCARLSYETWVQYEGKEWLVTGYGHGRVSLLPSVFSSVGGPCPLVEEVRPYLRPMSSMTEKEKEELKEEHKKDERIYAEVIEKIANGDEHARGTAVLHFAVEWCDEHHFDYRELIPMGLAFEAPEGMYN